MKTEIYYLIKHMKYCRYSEKTIKTYVSQVQIFLESIRTDPKSISEKQIKEYLYHKVFNEHVSASSQNIIINALKLFFTHIVIRSLNDEIFIRPRKSKYLPTVLSKDEVNAIINSIHNLKHKTIISTIYSCGLRISEAINLKISDIDSKRMIIYIRQSKGGRDRILPLSNSLLELLRKYWLLYKPKLYLFEGIPGGPYSRASISIILERAVRKNKILKKVSVHTLRHSYATHLMDAGVNLRYIQTMLGHKLIQTTQIYTHVSNLNLQGVYSPFDDIVLR